MIKLISRRIIKSACIESFAALTEERIPVEIFTELES